MPDSDATAAPARPAAGAESERRATETARKRRMALSTLEAIIVHKSEDGAWGKVVVELTFHDGYIKALSVTDVTTVQDLSTADGVPARRR